MNKAELRAIPEYGDVLTLEDFLDVVRHGGFVDYDGHGYYANDEGMSAKVVKPSHVQKRHEPDCAVYYGLVYNKCDCGRDAGDIIDEARVDRRYTKVVWFNK